MFDKKVPLPYIELLMKQGKLKRKDAPAEDEDDEDDEGEEIDDSDVSESD